jgi:DNA mismatch endonuclease (patch repair protein)
MVDVHDKETRSFNMSRIRSKDTKPEMLVRRFLYANGFRYKLHDKLLPGKPDIVLSKIKTVIFVNGCFWHGHDGCKLFVIPGTRTEWWFKKIGRNKERDEENRIKLENDGWIVFSIFECELKRTNQVGSLHDLVNKLFKIKQSFVNLKSK